MDDQPNADDLHEPLIVTITLKLTRGAATGLALLAVLPWALALAIAVMWAMS